MTDMEKERYLKRSRVVQILEDLHDSADSDDQRFALWDALCQVRAAGVEPLSDTELEVVWIEEPAKGGGTDVVTDGCLLQDDLDHGGWNLRLDRVRVTTLDEAKALAARLLAVVNKSHDHQGEEK